MQIIGIKFKDRYLFKQQKDYAVAHYIMSCSQWLTTHGDQILTHYLMSCSQWLTNSTRRPDINPLSHELLSKREQHAEIFTIHPWLFVRYNYVYTSCF